MRAGLTILVFVLHLVALLSVLGMPARIGRKLAWCMAIVLVPVLGALAWLAVGRTRGMVTIRHER